MRAPRIVLNVKVAEENLPAPTKSDEQLVPVKARLPAFAASANVPSIYIQQLWNTLIREAKTRVYRFQLDEQWFTLNYDLLRDALEITPVDPTNPFMSPPTSEKVMDFMNELVYPEEIHFVSHMHVNHLYQPWRAIMSLINQTNVDYVELLWEEFIQGIQVFFTYWDSNKVPSKKPTPHVIPYCRFTKLIIYYLGSKYNIHRRLSPLDMLRVMIFFLVISSSSPKQYMEMIARKVRAKKGGKKKTTPKADKPAPAKQPKPVKEKISKPSPTKQSRKGKVAKVQKGKSPLKLVDEDEEVHVDPVLNRSLSP
ncbi:hypothetical protein Tco_1228625 [Tanacetum coccineum]